MNDDLRPPPGINERSRMRALAITIDNETMRRRIPLPPGVPVTDGEPLVVDCNTATRHTAHASVTDAGMFAVLEADLDADVTVVQVRRRLPGGDGSEFRWDGWDVVP